MKSHHQVALSVLTLCISQQLYAQNNVNEADAVLDAQTSAELASSTVSDKTPNVTLDTINVTAKARTGTALAQKISEMPAVTQVITENEIQMQATGDRTTGDILAQLIPSLGASSGSTSNYGTTMHGRPVQFLLNGVPLSSSRSLSRELNSIDPVQLDRVEVLSGATSIYGAGAAGGLINLVTKSLVGYGPIRQTRVGVSSSRNFESDSLGYHVGQTLGYGGERVYGRLDVDYDNKGGKFDSEGNRISPDVNQTDQQDTESLSVNGSLGVELTDSQRLDLAVTYYKDEQDTDYGPDYGDGLAVLFGAKPSLKAIDGANVENEPYTTKTSMNLNYNNDDIAGSSLSVTGYYRDEKGRFYPSGKTAGDQATEVWQANGLTDEDTLKKLAGAATFVTQSEADIEVMGLRAAMQTETEIAGKKTLFSYGADVERENSEQTYYGQDLNTFLASNGLSAQTNGLTYNGGPDTTIDKWGAFVNADVDITDKWHTSAGVRYQKLKSETDTFTPIYEQLLEEYFDSSAISGTSAAYGIDYQAGNVEKGSTDHDKTLFNLGTSYQLTPNDQIFANFSQGFTTADIQRALRDVRAGFVVNSDNVQPIAINNYEFGWQGKHGDTAARLSSFYNESDKVVRFTDSYTVEVVDTDERVYGVEGSLSHDISDKWQVGGSVAYTRGQYDKDGDWLELDAVRLTPLKGTAFAQYNFDEGSNIRLQALAIGGDDKAFKDQQKDPDSSALPVTGYMTLDVLGQVNMPVGRVDYGVYNLLNKDYLTVYHQTTFGDLNRLPASGTTYGLSYTVDY
ncbi:MULTISPECIES: TonB-dependent receptor [unclassified Psychrobacter]|uniref:TonB-dependent receptor n=2 Tax=Psychrobacter TaxID=497 RepID=UPI00086EBAD9|nr:MULTISPECIES: TonB-dependent receptor [unclassified Psychrobacter]OEH66908.1 MAG: TonB-dependent receptor [Psychrobacter sp. B29-1]PKG65128.1 TonB-dependent receptor [Psychrobacter sp. Choline-02u-13]PKH55108.1 TonB-dependent receptor [Psychrobacter sp. Choline-02u-9]TEW88116.1 TonB-dependent receptor [Psychrobacter sp. 230]|tara:strand:+ start:6124 stop:8505 length:2382 start_codon:yes stop_codon:yes gene_type:complete